MIGKIFFLYFVFFSGLVYQQAFASDLNNKISRIRADYKEIKIKEKNFNKKVYLDKGDEIERKIIVYKDKKEIKIISVCDEGLGDGSNTHTIYYRNSIPFFVLDEWSGDAGGIYRRGEERYYIENGKMIKYLHGPEKKDVSINSKEFVDAEQKILTLIIYANKYLKK